MKILSLFCVFLVPSLAKSDTVTDFKKIYKKLEIPMYELSHEKNIDFLIDLLKKPSLATNINKLKNLSFSCKRPSVCKLLKHEVKRLQLRQSFAKKLQKNNIKNSAGLKKGTKLYKEGYKLAVSEWTNDFNFSFKKISKFEKKEIVRIRKLLEKTVVIENKRTSSAKEVVTYLKNISRRIEGNLNKLFLSARIAPAQIKLNKNPESQNIPGYYDASSGTFYFSMPEGQVSLGDLDWLFLHEASPGHHMQTKIDKGSVASQLFNRDYVYLDFVEGWAAYVETYGVELGVYKTSAAKRKALEWDLLRSTRVLIDIGLHLRGWTKARAKKEWEKLAPEVLSLADREIDRMLRWPAQVISYEYGKMNFIKARDKHLKKNKSLLTFHQKVLNFGQVPTSFL